MWTEADLRYGVKVWRFLQTKGRNDLSLGLLLWDDFERNALLWERFDPEAQRDVVSRALGVKETLLAASSGEALSLARKHLCQVPSPPRCVTCKHLRSSFRSLFWNGEENRNEFALCERWKNEAEGQDAFLRPSESCGDTEGDLFVFPLFGCLEHAEAEPALLGAREK